MSAGVFFLASEPVRGEEHLMALVNSVEDFVKLWSAEGVRDLSSVISEETECQVTLEIFVDEEWIDAESYEGGDVAAVRFFATVEATKARWVSRALHFPFSEAEMDDEIEAMDEFCAVESGAIDEEEDEG